MEPTHIFLTSLWCVGLWKAFDGGMIFSKVDLYLSNKLPNVIYKPLIGCIPCMASIHGAASYFIFVGVDLMVIPFVVCVCGMNVILTHFLD